jgi:hypothetical protein
MGAQLAFLGFVLVQSLVLGVVVVALCDIVQRACGLNRLLTFAATLLALGIIGYASFWLAFANYALFGVLKIVCLLGLAVYFGVIVYRRWLGHYSWLAEPLLFTFLFFIAVFTLCFTNGGLDDPGATIQTQFGFAGDHLVPRTFADFLRNPARRIDTEWLSSDRPPLQTGLYLFLALQTGGLGYQVVATFLQATFLMGVWVIAAAAGLPAAARRMTMLACCVLPTTITNTYYTWPKMLSVSYLMVVFAFLFCGRAETPRERTIVGLLLGGSAALSMLSHGGAAFVLIGFAIIVLAAWHWPSWRTVLAGGATFVLLYAPWIAYQRLVDPPGNRLLKWHLAGVIDIDSRSFLEALHDAYGPLTWHDYIAGRLANLAVMLGGVPQHLWDIVRLGFDYDPALVSTVHESDFYRLLPSLHVFSIALLLALALMPSMTDRSQRRTAILL